MDAHVSPKPSNRFADLAPAQPMSLEPPATPHGDSAAWLRAQRAVADDAARMLLVRKPFNPGWDLSVCEQMRAEHRHPDRDEYLYTGPREALDVFLRHRPHAMLMEAVDRYERRTHVVATAQPADLAHLFTAAGTITPHNTAARGQIAIDIARVTRSPCLLVRNHDVDPSAALLHRASERNPGLTRDDMPQAWRLTFIERIGPTDHVYPQSPGACGIATMVGNAIGQGYTHVVGHRPSVMDQRLRGALFHGILS